MKLYGRKQWGSMLVEAQLDWYGLAYDFVSVGDLLISAEARAEILPVNPVGHIPAVVLDSGQVMTESAAITLHLADITGSDALVPGPDSPARPAFLRWLVFLVANVYPTFVYADDPSRFVADARAREGFGDTVNAYAKRLYGIIDKEAGEPWFLGDRFSAIDIFLCCMTRWRPGRDWFADHAARLHGIASRADDLPRLKPCWERNLTD